MFLDEINEYVKDLKYKVDDIGRSGDKVYIFEDKYVLKVSSDINRLEREKERVDFLYSNNIPSSKSICFSVDNGYCYYLRTCINGVSLIDERFINNPNLLIDVLVNVVKILRSLDNSNCPFKSNDNVGEKFVHGDLCLPNIMVDSDNNFVGFIDLDNSGLGDEWYDYSWMLWSLEYNLGTNKYNKILLNKLGLEFNLDKYNLYIPLENRNKNSNS